MSNKGKAVVPQGTSSTTTALTFLALVTANLRSLAKHLTEACRVFVETPAVYLEAELTDAQRCGAFNLAMSAYGIGLQMPTDSAGKKVWDGAVYARGMELAKGRKLTPQVWVHQSFSPPIIPGKDKRRSFYETVSQHILRGKVSDVSPEQFTTGDAEENRKALRDFIFARLTELAGSKDKPGPLIGSRSNRWAVRADWIAAGGGKVKGVSRSNLTDEALLAELE